MIKTQVLFLSDYYNEPKDAPAWEQQTAETIREWVNRAVGDGTRQRVPVIPLSGPGAIDEESYQKFRLMANSSAYPTPVAFALRNPDLTPPFKNANCLMWIEDQRGLPDTLDDAKNTLEYVHMTNMYRLPL